MLKIDSLVELELMLNQTVDTIFRVKVSWWGNPIYVISSLTSEVYISANLEKMRKELKIKKRSRSLYPFHKGTHYNSSDVSNFVRAVNSDLVKDYRRSDGTFMAYIIEDIKEVKRLDALELS